MFQGENIRINSGKSEINLLNCVVRPLVCFRLSMVALWGGITEDRIEYLVAGALNKDDN